MIDLFLSGSLAAVALSVWVLSLIAQDCESHWMEGVQLLALYIRVYAQVNVVYQTVFAAIAGSATDKCTNRILHQCAGSLRG